MPNRYLLKWVLAVAGWLTLAHGACAQAEAFSDCDGRASPVRGADGMDILLENPFQAANSANPGDHVAACDAALADPRAAPEIWTRRLSLLEARALWRLLQQAPDLASRDLDEAAALGAAHHADAVKFGPSETTKLLNPLLLLAEAGRQAAEGKTAAKRETAGESDAQYARTTGLGQDMINAMRMGMTGDLAASRSAWLRISAAAPFDGPVQAAALVNLRAGGAGIDSARPAAGRLARLGRPQAMQAMDVLLDFGGVAEATALYKALSTPPDDEAEKPHGLETYDMEAKRLLATTGEVSMIARLAYRQLQAGDVDDANLTFADARRLAVGVTSQMGANGRLAKILASRNISHDTVQRSIDVNLKIWSDLMHVRSDLAARRPVDLTALLSENPVAAKEEIDLLQEVMESRGPSADDGAVRSRIAAISAFRAVNLAPSRAAAAIWMAEVPPETQGQVADLNRTAPFDLSGLLHLSANHPDGTSQLSVVRLLSRDALTTAPMSDRMVYQVLIYRAAKLARASSKAGFLILSSWVRKTSSSLSHDALSDESYLEVRLLPSVADNPAALPALEVLARLEPRYGVEVAR